MGMTLWLRVRRGETIECDDPFDYSLMNCLAPELDSIAVGLGVRPPSEFHEFTDMNRDFADLGEESDGEDEADAPACPAPAVDDYGWFDSRDGLASVEALLRHVRDDPSLFRFEGDSSRGHWRDGLIEELDDCRSGLGRASEQGLPFHLTLVG